MRTLAVASVLVLALVASPLPAAEQEAEARATHMVSTAIAKGDIQAINYFIAQKYVEALQTIGQANNQKVLFLPMEATGIIGAIGGVGELVKEAMAQRGIA